MTTRDDVLERLAMASAQPWGPARSSLVAEAVTWADALEDEELAIDTRLALAESYNQGNEEWKALAPFVWLLDRHAQRPDLFDARRTYDMNWNYKWAIHVAADNPGVSASQLEELQAGLEEFYRAQGASMHVVHGERHHAAVMLGLEERAEEELAAWRATPRDESSDCEGCDPVRQVRWATAHGDWELAVSTAVPVLDEVVGCAIQPARMQAAALMALLRSGRPRAAWQAHVRSVRNLRSQPQFLAEMGQHLEFLALTGRLTRGLKVLRECLGMTDQAESAAILMELLTGAALVLREAERAGLGEEPVGVEVPAQSVWCPGPGLSASTTIATAREEIADWALRVAARYDRRNGNTTISDRVRARLAQDSLIDDDEIASRGALADAGAELLEQGEDLPEGIRIGQVEEDLEGVDVVEGIMDGIAAMPGLLDDAPGPDAPAGGADERASASDGTDGAPGSAGEKGAPAGGAGEDEDPFPVVDLRLPFRPIVDGEDALRRLEELRARPGGSLESLYIGCQTTARGLLPDPATVAPELGPIAWAARAAAAEIAWDYETAVEDRLRARALLTDEDDELKRIHLDLTIIGLEHRADVLAERVNPEATAERLDRAAKLAAPLAARVEDLLADPQGRETELVRAFDATIVLVSLLPDLNEHEGATESLEQASRIAPHVAHLMDPIDGELTDHLDLLRAGLALEREDVYEACLIADEVLRRHNPCPVLLALVARQLLATASTRVGEYEEAVRQLRECLNVYLATGLTPLTGAAFGSLASALGASGRALEAAEVLETALSSDLPEVVADHIRRVLVMILDELDEEQGVLTNALVVAERALEGGATARASEYLVRAANAAGNLNDNVRAASLFERAADLEDVSGNTGKVRRSGLLRRAARAIVDDLTLAMSRARLDEARVLMTGALELIEDVPSSRRYSAAYEMGDWHDDYAWILWRTDENAEAVEHCEAAFAGYMSTEDRNAAARPLALLVRLHAERDEVDQARAAIARVRELLAHRRWEGHPALAMVDQVEESLED